MRDAAGDPIVWTPTRLAHRYTQFRNEKDAIEAELSRVNLELETVTRMLIDSYNAEEADWGTYGASKETVKLPSGDSVRLEPGPHLKVEDKEKFRQYCLKVPDLAAAMAIPWQTGNSLMKELLLKGQPEPPGTKAYRRFKVVYTPFKGAEKA
jgi:hypothetical protein